MIVGIVGPIVDPYLTELNDTINELLLEPTDFVTCTVLKAIAPVVNLIDPAILYIDPADGDTDLFGTPFWLCPPYES